MYNVFACFRIFGFILEKMGMTKKLPLLFIIIAFTIAAHAQPSVLNTSATPKASYVLGLDETEYDFGKIPQGKPVMHIFVVTDNGKDSLKITNVQASCGCTTPQWDRDKTEAPGEKTNITIGYNAANAGPFSKTITITYNNAQTRQIVIKGEVWETSDASAPENKEVENLKNL